MSRLTVAAAHQVVSVLAVVVTVVVGRVTKFDYEEKSVRRPKRTSFVKYLTAEVSTTDD